MVGTEEVFATNEKPLPKRSTNMTLPKYVSDYEVGCRVMSDLRRKGPMPARLRN